MWSPSRPRTSAWGMSLGFRARPEPYVGTPMWSPSPLVRASSGPKLQPEEAADPAHPTGQAARVGEPHRADPGAAAHHASRGALGTQH
eukprot:2740470-Alexandrium_andersonii.AAC.2